MRGKFQKKTPADVKKKAAGKQRYLPGILAVVLMTLVAVLAVALQVDSGEQSETTQAAGEFTTAATENTMSVATEEASTFRLGRGIEITKIGKYTGIYMEDGSNDVVSDILMVMVTNTGTQCIQYAQFQLTDGETVADFSLSTLMPGDTMVVLETGRMTYSDALSFTEANLQSVAVFNETPGMCEEQIRIQCLDGVLNITNISGKDITGDIVIYYKNSAQGIYYGGITYRGRIEGGLKAGEIRQVVAEHYSTNGSTVVFVTCG